MITFYLTQLIFLSYNHGLHFAQNVNHDAKLNDSLSEFY